MRINELILENQQLDELSFAGVGKGIGQVASGVGQAVGGIKGAYQGVKQRYSQGKQQAQQGAYNAVTGSGQQQPAPAQSTQTAQPNSSSPNAATQARINAAPHGYDGETGQPNAAPSATTQPASTSAPAQNTQQANPQDAGDGRIEPTLSPEPAQGQQPAATTPPSGQATTPPAAGAPAEEPPAAPDATQAPAGNTRARMGAPEGRKAVDQAVSTVKQVRSDRRAQVVNYGKQQFDALAGAAPTAESRVGYRSRFLDMDI
jgi:hypothetical protein